MSKKEIDKMITDLRNYAKRLVVDERNDEFLLVMRASFMLEELLKEGTPVPTEPVWRPIPDVKPMEPIERRYIPTWVPNTDYQYKAAKLVANAKSNHIKSNIS